MSKIPPCFKSIHLFVVLILHKILYSSIDTNYFREIVEEQLHSCKEKEQEYLGMLDISDVKYLSTQCVKDHKVLGISMEIVHRSRMNKNKCSSFNGMILAV